MTRETPEAVIVAIVEDDQMVRESLAEQIAATDGLELVGAAGSISDAAALIAKKPDIFLLDLGLPDGDGASLIAHIKAACDAKIVVLTSFGDRTTVIKTIEAGADGYLLKDSSAADIMDAIESAISGGAPISAAAAVHLLERLRAQIDNPQSDERPTLSAREAQLLQLFAKGYSYKETARLLSISPLTVGNHVRSIYRKLDVHTRSEAVYEALRMGTLKI
jgi:DNA-binding NarL/FixJ family response regulator